MDFVSPTNVRTVVLTELQKLLAAKPHNSFTLLTLSAEQTGFANALPRTLINFDAVATNGTGTWPTDAAVAASPMAGVGAATNPSIELTAFSGTGIHFSGKAAAQGGGHLDSGDGSVYTVDPEVAAANINGGGSGIPWTMSLESCRYIDAFVFGRPSALTSPAGNQQDGPSITPTGPNQVYWLGRNKNGIAMPGAGHTYHGNQFLGSKMLISQWGSMDPNQGCSPNAGYAYDILTNTMVGPLITSAGMPANGGTTLYGYFQDNNGSATNAVANERDGCLYSLTLQNFAYRLYKWTNPADSSLALIDTGCFSATTQPNLAQAAGIIFPDPSDPTQDIYFAHSFNGGNDTNFLAITGIKTGSTPTMNFQTYASGTITPDALNLMDYAWDSLRKVIWMTDGQHLFKVTPDVGGNLAAWTVVQVTGFTGDVPPDATIPGSSPMPSLRYLAFYDCLAHVYAGAYRAYKI